jgi:TRAP-type C4-dicarboxylate transport system permease small subunit
VTHGAETPDSSTEDSRYTLEPPDFAEAKYRPLRLLLNVQRVISMVLLLTVLGLVAMQVVSRYVFEQPYPWTEELARFSLVWLTFLSAGLVMARGRHVTVVLGSRLLGERTTAAMEAFASLVVATVGVLLVLPAADFIERTGRTSSPGASVPMSWVYGAALVGMGLIALHAVINAIVVIRHPQAAHSNDQLAREGA